MKLHARYRLVRRDVEIRGVVAALPLIAQRLCARSRHRKGGRLALGDAQIKYSTVQNWYTGDKEGKGGIYNFVTNMMKVEGDV